MFKTLLIGGEPARRAAFKIGEFDYLCNLPFSVVGFVNPNSTQRFTLVNCGWEWHDLPIYKDLSSVIGHSSLVNSIGIYFNAKHVLYWVREVIKYPRIKNVVIFAEDVPERDAREICHLSLVTGKNIVGPSSTGIISAGSGRLGEIGGDWNNLNLCRLDRPGNVGIITKSGTISGELLWIVAQNSPGVHTAVQIGGDAFPATDFVWWLEKYSQNPEIKTVVMAGEAGGDLEERAAIWYERYIKDGIKDKGYEIKGRKMEKGNVGEDYARNQRSRKTGMENKFKLITVISGKFLETMPKGQKFGHAGAKQEESGHGSAKHKVQVLKKAGVEVVEFEELGEILKDVSNKF